MLSPAEACEAANPGRQVRSRGKTDRVSGAEFPEDERNIKEDFLEEAGPGRELPQALTQKNTETP